jgi:hypothetical protein
MKNANDNYQQFIGGDDQHRLNFGHTMTEGVYQLCTDYQCFWLIEVILSHQHTKKVKKEPFQVWKLERVKDDEFKVTATDGNDNIIAEQVIEFSDFKDDEVTIWNIDRTILLPNEY